jgi:hypothetical protein
MNPSVAAAGENAGRTTAKPAVATADPCRAKMLWVPWSPGPGGSQGKDDTDLDPRPPSRNYRGLAAPFSRNNSITNMVKKNSFIAVHHPK